MCYAKNPLFIEKDLCRFGDWTPTEVSQRRGEILEWARKRWYVEPPSCAGAPGAQDADEGKDEEEDEDGSSLDAE